MDKRLEKDHMKQKPDMTTMGLWNLSLGLFGVQVAYALQSSNITRIFSTLGADAHSLSLFWILPPLMGLFVQPLVGKYSDRTWCRWGRRVPYLFIGAAVAVAVMCLLPNSGSLHLDTTTKIWGLFTLSMVFGLAMLVLLDTSVNMAMQPFKMIVGDMVNERQKKLAYSIQSFLCNVGSVAGFLLPLVMTLIGVSNTAEEGVVPDSVIYSFYAGAVLVVLCVIYTKRNIREWSPEEYALYNGEEEKEEESPGLLALLRKAPAAFWSIFLVQFFCWAAFLIMWTYTNGTVAANGFHTPVIDGRLDSASESYQAAGNWVGMTMAVQAVAAMLWALVMPRIRSTRGGYALSLVLGAAGFISMYFWDGKWGFCLSEALIGCTWAAAQAFPLTLLTNALQGKGHMGSYLGLFNCSICLPQIVAASVCGVILRSLPLAGNGAENEPMMMVLGGILLLIGAASVALIRGRD